MRTQIIAEIGANHGGNMDLAKDMARAAAGAGCDFVKYQSWKASTLKPGDPNFERHSKAELSDDAHRMLVDYCRELGSEFLTTCFDRTRVDFLATLGLKTIKVASPDASSYTMIGELLDAFEHVIISTGMTPEEDLVKTFEIIKGRNATILHCVSLYPTPSHLINLSRMDWLKGHCSQVGFSDHSMGVEAGKLAIARGASILEKHFTSDRTLPGKDQQVSGLPYEFRELRAFAEQVESMMGQAHPALSETEQELRGIYIGKWGDNA